MQGRRIEGNEAWHKSGKTHNADGAPSEDSNHADAQQVQTWTHWAQGMTRRVCRERRFAADRVFYGQILLLECVPLSRVSCAQSTECIAECLNPYYFMVWLRRRGSPRFPRNMLPRVLSRSALALRPRAMRVLSGHVAAPRVLAAVRVQPRFFSAAPPAPVPSSARCVRVAYARQ